MTRALPFAAALTAALFAVTPLHAQEGTAKEPACKDDPLYHQLDFTIGKWAVTSKGAKHAEVTMSPILDGCAIAEKWDNPKGVGNGAGLFTYSRALKAWTYNWASDQAAASFFQAELIKPGHMRFVTQRPTPAGRTLTRHWNLIAMPDGTVRELANDSEDGGETWKIAYDLTWTKL